jgi:hypothetical protein
MLLEKPARPTLVIKVVAAVPASADLRLASFVHRAEPPMVEKDALAGSRFEREEGPRTAGQCLRVPRALLIGEEDAHDELPIVTAAGAPLRTVAAVRTFHALFSLFAPGLAQGSVDEKLLFVGD